MNNICDASKVLLPPCLFKVTEPRQTSNCLTVKNFEKTLDSQGFETAMRIKEKMDNILSLTSHILYDLFYCDCLR